MERLGWRKTYMTRDGTLAWLDASTAGPPPMLPADLSCKSTSVMGALMPFLSIK